MSVLRALRAEQLKTRRTLALLLAPIAPLAIIALQMAMVIDRKQTDTWEGYGAQTLLLWLLLMFPLFITLESALLANLEHTNQQWKHLCALPVPSPAILVAKYLVTVAVLAISMIAFYVYTVASGLSLRVILPNHGFEAPVPWLALLEPIMLSFATSLLLISIHLWLALRWPNFVLPIAVGIVAMVAAVMLLQSDYSAWYPWTMPALVARTWSMGQDIMRPLLLGVLGGLVVAIAGCWDVSRRDVL